VEVSRWSEKFNWQHDGMMRNLKEINVRSCYTRYGWVKPVFRCEDFRDYDWCCEVSANRGSWWARTLIDFPT